MLLQGNCSDKLSRLLLNKKDTWKVNVLSSTLSFAIRDFSCKSLKGFQKSRFPINYVPCSDSKE